MRNYLILAVLSVTLFGTSCASFKESVTEAGKEIAREAIPIIADSAAKHGAEAGAKIVAAQVAKDDHLTAEEKTDITTTLYGAGGATLASLLAALRMWALARGRKVALGIVTKAVDAVPGDIGDAVKAQVAALGGNVPAVKKTITAAKS